MTNEGKSDNYKWVALGLLTIGYFMQQGTRQIFNAVLPQLKDEFPAVASSDWGNVMAVFSLVYGFAVLFGGVLGDLFSRKKIIAFSLALFSAMCVLAGFARPMGPVSITMYLTIVIGVVFAIGQCLLPSSSTSILSQLHDKTRSTALSIMQTALYISVVLVSLGAGWISGLGKGTWSYAYWIFGGIGLVWFLVICFFLRDTKPLPPAPGAPAKASVGEAFKSFVVKPSAWLLMLAFGFQVFTNFGFTVWTPVYMKEAYFNDPTLTGTAAAAGAAFHSVIWHYAGCLIGIIFASRISDKLAQKWKPARMTMNLIGLATGAPCIFLSYYTNSLTWCCTGLFLFGIAHGIYDSNMFAALYDVIKPRYRAAATGFFCFGAFVMGSLAPKLLGALKDSGISYKDCLSGLSLAYLAGAVVVLVTIMGFMKKDFES